MRWQVLVVTLGAVAAGSMGCATTGEAKSGDTPAASSTNTPSQSKRSDEEVRADVRALVDAHRAWSGDPSTAGPLLKTLAAQEGKQVPLYEALSVATPSAYTMTFREMSKDELRLEELRQAQQVLTYVKTFPTTVAEEPAVDRRRAMMGRIGPEVIGFSLWMQMRGDDKQKAMWKKMSGPVMLEIRRLYDPNAKEALCFGSQTRMVRRLKKLNAMSPEERQTTLSKWQSGPQQAYRVEVMPTPAGEMLQATGVEVEVQGDVLAMDASGKITSVFNRCRR